MPDQSCPNCLEDQFVILKEYARRQAASSILAGGKPRGGTMLHVKSDAPDAGPEQAALLAARRWSLVTAATIGVVIQAGASAWAWQRISPAQQFVTVLVVLIVAAGAALSRHDRALSSLVFAAWMLVAANALPGAQAPWLLINSAALFGAFGIGLLLRRSLLIPAVLAFPVILHIAWSAHPDDVLASGFAVFDGWIPCIQVGVVILAMGQIRDSLLREALVMDAAFRVHLDAEAASATARARSHARRRTAIAIHESLLNTIRSVLAVNDVDRPRLRQALLRVAPIAVRTATIPNLGLLRERVIEDAGGNPEVHLTAPTTLALSDDAFESVRAALVELIRNHQRHGDEGQVVVRISTSGDRVVAAVDAAPWNGDPLRSGIGLRTAVGAGISALGGTVRRSGGVITLEVRAMAMPLSIEFGPTTVFSRSRAFMSMFLASMASSGVLYFIALALGSHVTAAGLTLTVVALLAGLSTMVLSWQRRQRILARVIPIVALPIAIPWIALWMYSDGCPGQEQVLTSALNVSGFMVLVITLWSRWWILLAAMGLWLGGVITFALEGAASCESSALLAAFNSLIFLPAVIAAVLLAARFYARAEHVRNEQRANEILHRTAMNAQEQVNAELEALIREATDQLDRLASGVPLDRAAIDHMRQLEGRIRLAVQVDPQHCGAFGKVAQLLLDEVVAAGGFVNVRSLEPSLDPRPIPPPALGTLRAFIHGRDPAIAAFCDGLADYFTVTSSIPEAELPWPGLEHPVECKDVEIGIEWAAEQCEDGDRFTLVVVRPALSGGSSTP